MESWHKQVANVSCYCWLAQFTFPAMIFNDFMGQVYASIVLEHLIGLHLQGADAGFNVSLYASACDMISRSPEMCHTRRGGAKAARA